MSDNTTINPGAGGDVVADDELNTVNGVTQQSPKPKAQRVKTGFGPAHSVRDVDGEDPAHGLPVQAVPGAQRDGHSLTLGATDDDAAALTVVGRLKAIVGLLAGTLNVADSAGLSKLEAIRGLLAGTLAVTDTTAEAKLEAIRALLAGTVSVDLPAGPLAVADATAEGKLEAVRALLAGTLSVDATGSTVAVTGTVGVADSTAETKLEAVRVLLAGTLSVGDATAETKLEAVRVLLAGTLTVDGSAHTQPVSQANPADQSATLTTGRKTVTTAGTALALRATLACKWVAVSALDTNTQLVYVGGSAVLAAAGSQAGIPLLPGASVTIPVDDVDKVYVDSRVNGEGVSFLVGS